MKIRYGFVSNSSSTSFIIYNKTNSSKDIVDFATETLYLVDDYCNEYETNEKKSAFLADAEDLNITFLPGEATHVTFGDEDGTTLGRVYDYMLRDGGSTDSFTWEFYEYNR